MDNISSNGFINQLNLENSIFTILLENKCWISINSPMRVKQWQFWHMNKNEMKRDEMNWTRWKKEKESMQHIKSIAYTDGHDTTRHESEFFHLKSDSCYTMEWCQWYRQYEFQFYARPHFTSAEFFSGVLFALLSLCSSGNQFKSPFHLNA